MASGFFKIFVIFISLIINILSCQENFSKNIDDDGFDGNESSMIVGKRAKFAFAKRYPSRFAFAKRHDDEDINYYDKRAERFDFLTRPMRHYAFAKRIPYVQFA